MRHTALLVICLAAIGIGTAGAECVDYGDYMHLAGVADTPGGARVAVVQGDLAYVADSTGGLTIVDVADLHHPVVVGNVATPDPAYDVAVSGDYAYVADRATGVLVIDVSDPTQPEIVATVDTPGSAEHLALSGSLLAVADVTAGLILIDVSDPLAPQLRSSITTALQTNDVALYGDEAYVLNQAVGLYVFKVSDPSHPQLEDHSLSGYFYNITVIDGIAYLEGTGPVLTVADVHDPLRPTVLQTVEQGSIQLSRSVGGDLMFGSDNKSLNVYDLAADGTLTFRSSMALSAWGYKVTVDGDYALVTCGSSGVHVIDVSHPDGHPVTGEYGLPEGTYSVTAIGDLVFAPFYTVYSHSDEVIEDYGLYVIDVADPTAPDIVNFLDIYRGNDIAVKGQYAYIPGEDGRFNVVDMADPGNAQTVGTVEATGSLRKVAVGDGYAYVSRIVDYATAGIQLIDVSDPANPTLAGSLDRPGTAYEVAVAGGVAYVACGDDGVWAVDVSNPAAPVEAVLTDTPGDARALAVYGSHLLVADRVGLRVLDISDPKAPWITANVPTPATSVSVTVAGHLAYVGETGYTVMVVDLSNPDSPSIRGYIDNPEHVHDVAVSGDLVHVIGDTKLTMDPTQCGDVVPTVLRSFDLFPLQDAVSVRWQVATSLDDPQFRLTADDGARQWDVAYQTIAPRAQYAAEDGSRFLKAGVDVVYTLSVSEDGANWTELGRASTALAGPPDATRLLTVYPNPFNPRTTVRFECREPGRVSVAVHDLAGRRIATLADGWMESGRHELTWDGTDAHGRPVAAGPYFVRLRMGDRTDVKRMMLVR